MIRLIDNKPARFLPMPAAEFIFSGGIGATYLRKLATFDIGALRFNNRCHGGLSFCWPRGKVL